MKKIYKIFVKFSNWLLLWWDRARARDDAETALCLEICALAFSPEWLPLWWNNGRLACAIAIISVGHDGKAREEMGNMM